jgi:hypothetical protein
MHSILKKSEITFGCSVKCTLYKTAKPLFPTIFFLQKIFLIKAGQWLLSSKAAYFAPFLTFV